MTAPHFSGPTLTPGEVEKIRLILSTYQDGTGMLRHGDSTVPGWRDFERAVAVATSGVAQESKAVFDVLVPIGSGANERCYGVSCKMRSELKRIARDNRVTVEVSNAAGEFWRAVNAGGVTLETLRQYPARAGHALEKVVRGWHEAVGQHGENIDLSSSSYLILLWDPIDLEYQLFQFPLDLWDAQSLIWSVPDDARRLCGHDGEGNLVEWYFGSGGQLKWYPRASAAVWTSTRFRLERLPATIEPIVGKAASYFPDKWAAAIALQ